jgi:hypothetical protein
MKPSSFFLKALLLLIFPLFLACEDSGAQGQETNNEAHNNSTEKPEPKSQLPKAFKDFKVLELPIVLERPTIETVGDLVKKLGVAVVTQVNTDVKRNVFSSSEAVLVELRCTYAMDITKFEFTVLDKNANTVGEPIEIIYEGGRATMGNSWYSTSKITIENNTIVAETITRTTISNEATNPENPEYKTTSTTTKDVYEITPSSIIQKSN